MMLLREPSAESTRRFLTAHAKLNLSYSEVGATASQLPAGFVVDQTRIKLGEVEPVFQAAPNPAWISDRSSNAATIWPETGGSHAQGCSLR